MNNTKMLYTDRLILRKFTIDDVQGMYDNWAIDELCCRYLSWNVHNSIDFTKDTIMKWINEYQNGSYNWIVELKENHEVIGNISVVHLDKKSLTAEIGYCYGSKYWGNGYATDALRKVIEYLLIEEGIYLVEAKHISGNPASGKVMKKAGMHFDGILRDRRINKYTNERNDLVIYSIRKDEL